MGWIQKNKEFIKYVFFGGCTTLLNILVYYGETRFLKIDPYTANSISWIICVIFAYITNKWFVFESKSWAIIPVVKEFLSFLAARVLSLILDMGIMWVGIAFLGQNDMVVKILSNVMVILFNYFASKFFIFKT